jgi:hypothetical protein
MSKTKPQAEEEKKIKDLAVREADTGRKSKFWTSVYPRLDEIVYMYREGHTDKDVYTALGIGKSAFYRYLALGRNERDFIKIGDQNRDIRAFKEFKDAVDEGKRIIVASATRNLFRLAEGFHYDEERTESKKVVDKRGNPTGDVEVKHIKIKKYKYPDRDAIKDVLRRYDDTRRWSEPDLILGGSVETEKPNVTINMVIGGKAPKGERLIEYNDEISEDADEEIEE